MTSLRRILRPAIDVPSERPSRIPLRSRLAWMVLIWSASVLALALVAGVLRLALSG